MMHPSLNSNRASRSRTFSARRDFGSIVVITLVSALLFGRMELNEAVFSWTRPWEHWQLDELPAVLLVLCLGLAWFAWRRLLDARVELERRRSVEARLERLLLDNRRLAQQHVQALEAERKTLARELHDELGQYLNAIKIDAVSMQDARGSDEEVMRASSAVIRHTDHVYSIVRNRIRKLRPTALDELGLKAALEHCIDEWRSHLPDVRIDLNLEGDLDVVQEPVSLALYRLVQEGMTNAARHAHASRIEIRAAGPAHDAHSAGEVTLDIADDGCGADPQQRRTGLGLIGMRERVEALGGRLHICTAPSRGFRIVTRIPIVESDAECAA